jgi:DNA-binding CsgD family transcriptional regulator
MVYLQTGAGDSSELDSAKGVFILGERGLSDNFKVFFLLAGLSFYWLWLITGVFSSIVQIENDFSGESWAGILTLLANTLALGTAFLLAPRLSPLLRRPVLVIASAGVTAVGIICVTLSYNFNGLLSLLYIGCICTGLGAGLLILCWLDSSRALVSWQLRRLLFCSSMALSTLLYLLVVSLPPIASHTICALAPIISAVLFLVSDRNTGKDPAFTKRPERYRTSSKAPDKTLIHNFISLILCCLVLSFIQGLFESTTWTLDTKQTWGSIISIVDLFIIAIVVFELFWRWRRPGQIDSRLFLPLVIIVCLAIPYLVYQNPQVAYFFIFSGCLLVMIHLYSETDAISLGFRLPMRTFAAGLVAINTGTILGITLGNLLPLGPSQWPVGSICLTLGIAACLYHAFAAKRSEELSPAPSLAAEGDHAPVDGDGSKQYPPLENPSSIIDRVSTISHLIALQYLLSPREEEILFSLIRGKHASSIAQDMFISYNTVKTHINHIYHKLDLHSREELFRLVDSLDTFDRSDK